MLSNDEPDSGPWWRYPLVWLVIAGPAVVVVAGIFTFWLAVSTHDPLVAEDYYRRGVEINRTLADKGMLPALAGRNHVTTPAADVPAARR
ncbi:MAG TPA: FixH family protein [Candidatus Limnocylindrales bacterium]|nr:FixH family protein [Candidatus Limnocylindrales bacterium]